MFTCSFSPTEIAHSLETVVFLKIFGKVSLSALSSVIFQLFIICVIIIIITIIIIIDL